MKQVQLKGPTISSKLSFTRSPESILNDSCLKDAEEFKNHHLSFYGSYMYMNSPDKSHLIYQEIIKDYKYELKQKNEEIEILRNDLEKVVYIQLFILF